MRIYSIYFRFLFEGQTQFHKIEFCGITGLTDAQDAWEELNRSKGIELLSAKP